MHEEASRNPVRCSHGQPASFATATQHRARPHPDRARQFMPFAALKGYHELIAEQQRMPEPRRMLTDEEARELSRRIASFEKGELVRVVHYQGDAYVTTQGAVAGIDKTLRILRIVKQPIAFDDIACIETIDGAPRSDGW